MRNTLRLLTAALVASGLSNATVRGQVPESTGAQAGIAAPGAGAPAVNDMAASQMVSPAPQNGPAPTGSFGSGQYVTPSEMGSGQSISPSYRGTTYGAGTAGAMGRTGASYGGAAAAGTPYSSAPYAGSGAGATTPGGATPGALEAAAAAGTGPAAGAGGSVGSGAASINMMGDLGPVFVPRLLNANGIGVQPLQTGEQPVPPSPLSRTQVSPSTRGLKIAENMSPVPQDRVFFSFNYYNDVNRTLGEHFDSPIKNIMYYRYTFGFEKTFLDGWASIGLRLPIDNVSAASRNPNLNEGGNSTAVGNLGTFLKYVIAQDEDTGSLLSAGMLVDTQTGPNRLAGAPFIGGINTTMIQPFVGYLINRDRFFIQGFTAIGSPVNANVPLMLYNDIGLYYFLYRANRNEDGLLTAVVPSFEVHVNDPLNHRDPYNPFDIMGTPDICDLTFGLNLELNHRAVLTYAFVTPVTGPKPFTYEMLALLNFRFGPGARTSIFPVAGGG